MSQTPRRPAVGPALYFTLALSLGAYFTFAAVQGDYGLFRRVQLDAQAEALDAELATLTEEVAWMQNRTRRLSDAYLDLDLLDERARKVLGLVRGDEIVIR
ncbi:FtsB family cell division protein [Rhodovulum sp. YNF3179]|uniref:FtsB family cell division protein n=1 Tax=Rhodovulum sp. YNF3179 TaxID=3425127 RepID=UPI003D3471C9